MRMCVCACACVCTCACDVCECECVHVCVFVFVCVCERERERERQHAHVRAYVHDLVCVRANVYVRVQVNPRETNFTKGADGRGRREGGGLTGKVKERSRFSHSVSFSRLPVTKSCGLSLSLFLIFLSFLSPSLSIHPSIHLSLSLSLSLPPSLPLSLSRRAPPVRCASARRQSSRRCCSLGADPPVSLHPSGLGTASGPGRPAASPPPVNFGSPQASFGAAGRRPQAGPRRRCGGRRRVPKSSNREQSACKVPLRTCLARSGGPRSTAPQGTWTRRWPSESVRPVRAQIMIGFPDGQAAVWVESPRGVVRCAFVTPRLFRE